MVTLLLLGGAGFTLFACSENATLPLSAGIGPEPRLPPPNPTLIPTVNIAPAVGWSAGAHPIAAPGLGVVAFASGLDHPRNVYPLPNGDVLVAESNAPPKPEDSPGLRGFIMRRIMARAGAGVPSADRISLLRDADGDGVAETRTVFLQGLHSPFGMALIGDEIFVADTDAVRRYPYQTGQTSITDPGTVLTDLPAGPINHHWTKNLVASPDGRFLYVSIGSNSNVGENGLPAEEGRAQIWEVDARTGEHRSYATGLRNPNGLSFAPGPTPVLWTAVNERDEIGSDLVPDFMTSVRDGGFYGWPFSYYGQHVDERVAPQQPEMVARAIVPDYALGAHTASLGLAITARSGLPAPFAAGAFVGQHGSWNRRPPSGYRVIFIPFAEGRPNGEPIEVLTGFLNDQGQARGRPVGVALDGHGGLLVADDVGNIIWRVTEGAR
uniref:PQQ-dependent sugar dehydrogenase n=1 Tax=Humitalea rosea TaxID=990373 RepID=UPI001B8611F3|nr:sorbosone dehydrogenase family protein [Humitalea rosea]